MSKLRKSAKGKYCQIRIPTYCLHNPETVCLCHMNGYGWAKKSLYIHASYGCQVCHDIVDGRKKTRWSPETIKLWFLEGIIRTQEMMWKEGLITEQRRKNE